MKLSCLQENFSKALGIVGKAVATRATLPITNNVLIAARDSQIKLCATNLEIAISCWFGTMVDEEGSITVPARLLNEFVGSLPPERVDMALHDHNLDLKCARFEATMSGLSADDFPPIPAVGDGVVYEIDPEDLRLAISQVVFATASEDTRPVLTGVSAEFEGESLTMAAADGFRLAVHKAPLASKVDERTEVIIPGKALTQLGGLLADQEGTVQVAISPNKSQVLFRLSNMKLGETVAQVEVVSQLLQGTFPNYKQLIPQTYATKGIVNTSEFLRATKTASIFARDGSGIVRLQMVPGGAGQSGKLSISARSEQVGENMGELDMVIDGEAAKIAFNGRYVSDVLNAVHEEEIALETTTPSSPGVFRPVGSDRYIHIIMPMFVQW